MILTYEEAITESGNEKIIATIQKERHALETNKTWSQVNKEEVRQQKVLSRKRIFKVKQSERYKRHVQYPIESCKKIYYETFNLVVNTNNCLKILFALANFQFDKIKIRIKTCLLVVQQCLDKK